MKHAIVGIGTVLVLSVTSVVTAGIVVDDFNDDVLDSEWEVVKQTGGTFWDVSGGALNVGGPGGQQGGLTIRYNQAIGQEGSLRIDYEWIKYTGHKARVGLGLFGYDSYSDSSGLFTGEGVYTKGVRNYDEGLHGVDGGIVDGQPPHYHYTTAYPVPTIGSLMIERNGNQFRTRYLRGDVWHVLFEAHHDFGDLPLYPYLFTSNSDTNPAWQSALDNFNYEYSGAPVPESTSLAIWSAIALGGLGLAYRRRKRTA
jgi:hypothetical protein